MTQPPVKEPTATELIEQSMKVKTVAILLVSVGSFCFFVYGLINLNKTENQLMLDNITKEFHKQEILNVEQKNKDKEQDRSIEDVITKINNK